MAKKKEEVEVKNKKNSTTTKRVDSKKVQEKKETKNSNVSKKVEKIKKESNVISNEKKVINDLNNVSDFKNKKTLKIIIYSLISIVILGTLIYSIIESNERGKYFNSITFNNVDALMNNEEKSIIYWAQPNCGYCTQFTPIVKKVSFDKKVTFNYLNTANLTQDEYASMITYLSAYKEEYASGLGTPSLILVENGKIIDVSVGALSEDDLVNYLTIKELIK